MYWTWPRDGCAAQPEFYSTTTDGKTLALSFSSLLILPLTHMESHQPSSPSPAQSAPVDSAMNALTLEESQQPADQALQNSSDAQNNSTRVSPPPVNVATGPGLVPQLQLQEPSPVVASQQNKGDIVKPPSQRSSTASPNSRSPNNRTRALAEIPSAMDLYVGSSPKNRSAASSDTASSSGRSSTNENKHRFERLPNGGHRHHLCAPKRHQFLANQIRRFRDFLDERKDKHKDKEGHERKHDHHQGDGRGNGHGNGHEHHQINHELLEHPLSLLIEKIDDFEAGHHVPSIKQHSVKDDFVEKYGDLQHVVGRGAFGTVRLSIKKDAGTGDEVIFAIKEVKHNHNESQKFYMRRLTSEFCIASTLKHINVIQTLDLLQLHGDSYSEVMEYCPGGDLHSLIASAGTLSETEAGCFFAQLINGVAYLHSVGVAHRDLKPENLLLTTDGCLKIADFGNSEVFRMPWMEKVRASTSIRGSGPFIAPEEFTTPTFDARKVDTWSCGIIYMCMRLGRYVWVEASKDDPNWGSFLQKAEEWHKVHETVAASNSAHHPRSSKFINLAAIEAVTHATLAWPDHISEVINRLLEPNPAERWQTGHVLNSDWMQRVENCHPSEHPAPADQVLDESDLDPTPSQRVGSKVLQHDAETTGQNIVDGLTGTNAQDGASASPISRPISAVKI